MQGPQLHSLDRTIPLGLKNLPSILQRGKNKTSKDLICGLQGPAQQAAHKGPSDTLFGTGRSLERFTCSQWIMFWTEDPAGVFPTYTSNRLCKDTSTFHNRTHLAPHNRALPRPSEGPSAGLFPRTMFVFFQLNPKTVPKRCLQTFEHTQYLERNSSPTVVCGRNSLVPNSSCKIANVLIK